MSSCCSTKRSSHNECDCGCGCCCCCGGGRPMTHKERLETFEKYLDWLKGEIEVVEAEIAYLKK